MNALRIYYKIKHCMRQMRSRIFDRKARRAVSYARDKASVIWFLDRERPNWRARLK